MISTSARAFTLGSTGGVASLASSIGAGSACCSADASVCCCSCWSMVLSASAISFSLRCRRVSESMIDGAAGQKLGAVSEVLFGGVDFSRFEIGLSGLVFLVDFGERDPLRSRSWGFRSGVLCWRPVPQVRVGQGAGLRELGPELVRAERARPRPAFFPIGTLYPWPELQTVRRRVLPR